MLSSSGLVSPQHAGCWCWWKKHLMGANSHAPRPQRCPFLSLSKRDYYMRNMPTLASQVTRSSTLTGCEGAADQWKSRVEAARRQWDPCWQGTHDGAIEGAAWNWLTPHNFKALPLEAWPLAASSSEEPPLIPRPLSLPAPF